MLLTVTDIPRSIAFYEAALAPLGITQRYDYGPTRPSRPIWFRKDGRFILWLRQGKADSNSVHAGFVAGSRAQVDAAYTAALTVGGKDKGAPGIRAHYDPRYYAANVLDPDGYSLEFVYKSWQHS